MGPDVQLLTGIAGVAAFVLTVVTIPLYFLDHGPPTRRNVLTRALVDMFVLIAIIAWAVGFRDILIRTNPALEWLGMFCLMLAVGHVILTFTADSFQAGTVLGKTERLDPTLIGTGVEGSIVIYGPVSRLLEAVFLVTAGFAVLLSGVFPEWTAWLAFAIALFQFAFVPTLFSRTEPSFFYSINGWGIPIAGSLFLLWVCVVSVLLLL